MNDHELEAALRRVMTAREDEAERASPSAHGSNQHCRHRSAPSRWWPSALMDWNFAPAWPRVAALAGAAVLGITVGLSSFGTRIATDLDLVRVAAADDAAQCLRCRFSDGVAPMTMTMTMPDRSSRWLLIGSLALNLFFVGTIGALAVRHFVAPAQPAATERPRTAAGAHRAAGRAAAGGGRRETARGVPRA